MFAREGTNQITPPEINVHHPLPMVLVHYMGNPFPSLPTWVFGSVVPGGRRKLKHPRPECGDICLLSPIALDESQKHKPCIITIDGSNQRSVHRWRFGQCFEICRRITAVSKQLLLDRVHNNHSNTVYTVHYIPPQYKY